MRSVTSRSHRTIPNEVLHNLPSSKVTDRTLELEPWFWLANLLQRANNERTLSDKELRQETSRLARRFKADSRSHRLEQVRQTFVLRIGLRDPDAWLHRLTQKVASTLDFYANQSRAKVSIVNFETWATLEVDDHGRVGVTLPDPFNDFLSHLQGAEVGRIRLCENCAAFFYAKRTDQKACSKRCNSARRVRAWRNKRDRYEYARKLKSAGVSRMAEDEAL